MAKKISQLTQATEVKSDDVTVIVQDGETKKLPLNMMVTKQDIENKKVAGLAKLDEIEATYENDTYTPTITVKNKSSVKTGEGDEVDYSANVMDGHVKSAILKGNTLVNLIENSPIVNVNAHYIDYLFKFNLKSNTTYTAIFNVETDATDLTCGILKSSGSWNSATDTYVNGYNKILLTTTEEAIYGLRIRYNDVDTYSLNTSNVMLLEGDYTNIDIPYFEGMQSVKLPVLTTIGKNLFDGKLEKGLIDGTTGEPLQNQSYARSVNFIKVQSNISYILSEKNDSTNFRIYEYDENFGYIGFLSTNPFTTTSNTSYIKFRTYPKNSGDDVSSVDFEIMLERGNTVTTYEPYKTNILTTPADLELRGIGEGSSRVEDELDCLTGKVTERIGEIVLDGTQDMISDGNGVYIQVDDVKRFLDYTGKIACDKLPVMPTYGHLPGVENGISGYTNANAHLGKNWLYVKINNSINKDEVKEWLTQNPVTVQYQRVTESIKTVDLMPSGTHPSTTPYCWKNGHIQLSSSGLLPSLEYSVVTSRAGQINQNATMIVKNDKRIFDLEILLAGGLVNTTYQALTLQNQVETGLSKVSLNSETEPDYLLYHMIMKLIEEKAYKLDDLTEKVSVFYLYEKLSDEQFETIYSALYPFVEDEIVEEPVVEELPEVVEDEVIM